MTDTLHVHRTTLFKSNGRTETLDGREYRVFPCVLIVDNVVMNGLLYPPEELDIFVEAWNGRPIPLYHPEDADGDPLSANDPAVLEAFSMGHLFNVAHEDGRLKGEMWIDVAKCQNAGGTMLAALERLEAGEPTDISTGLFCQVEPTVGVMNGERYEGIARNIRPDHLALLPDQEGACNWQDGCGVPRTNRKQLMTNQKTCHCGHPVVNQHTGIMVALYPPADVAQRLELSAADLPEGATAVPAEELHLTLAYFGDIENTIYDQDMFMVTLADFASYAPVVWGEIHGIGRFNNEGQHAFYATFNSDYLNRWREELAWAMPSDVSNAFIPHITLAYLPPDAPTPNVMPEREVIAFKNLALAWGGRVTEFPLQGMERDTAVEATNTLRQTLSVNAQNNTDDKEVPMSNKEQVTQEEEPEVTGTEQVQEEPVTNEDEAVEETAVAPVADESANESPDLAGLVKQAVTEALAPFSEALAQIQANANQERTGLIDSLARNERCAFTAVELGEMKTNQLRKLARSLNVPVPDYSGRGERLEINRDSEPKVLEMPSVFKNGKGKE